MLITFRCPPELKDGVDALIRVGLYPDFSAFCRIAIENQLLLEQSQEAHPRRTPSPGETTLRAKKEISGRRRGKGLRDRTMSRNPETAAGLLEAGSTQFGQQLSNLIGPDAAIMIGSMVSSLFGLHSLPVKPPLPLPNTYRDIFEADQIVPVERWLFGQYNRLLPAKVSARALASIATEGKEALMLELAAPRIAEAASAFGEYLRSLDRRFGSHRDEALVIAFPEAGTEGEKGRLRYQSHFVGHLVRGEQGGLLVGLKLAVIQVHKNKPHIIPTPAGWEFARLPNPLLDEPVSEVPSRLGAEEISFLVRHITEHVPTELFAYRIMLALIAEGLNTPESVNHGLARYLAPGKSLEEEADFVSTQRGGVLGRMGDLGLVSRERQGTRIVYHLTAGGNEILARLGNPVAAQR